MRKLKGSIAHVAEIIERPITLIGITFSEKEKNISEYSFKEFAC